MQEERRKEREPFILLPVTSHSEEVYPTSWCGAPCCITRLQRTMHHRGCPQLMHAHTDTRALHRRAHVHKYLSYLIDTVPWFAFKTDVLSPPLCDPDDGDGIRSDTRASLKMKDNVRVLQCPLLLLSLSKLSQSSNWHCLHLFSFSVFAALLGGRMGALARGPIH